MRNYIRRKYFNNKNGGRIPVGAKLLESTSQTDPAIRDNGISSTGIEGAQFLEDISQIEPAIRHRGIRTTRFEAVGDWILETVEFREWKIGEGGVDTAVLFCSGNPGVGKTCLR